MILGRMPYKASFVFVVFSIFFCGCKQPKSIHIVFRLQRYEKMLRVATLGNQTFLLCAVAIGVAPCLFCDAVVPQVRDRCCAKKKKDAIMFRTLQCVFHLQTLQGGWGYGFSISARGILTKSLSCMSGWGRVRRSVFMLRLSYLSRSMSMGRSWYMPFCVFSVRPSSRSIFCVSSRHSRGVSSVSTRQAALMKGFSLLNPHGAVSMNDEVRATFPMRWAMRAMALRSKASRFPVLEPSPKKSLCIGG